METSADAQRPLRFASFELNLRSRELRTKTGRIRLQEQPFAILQMMLERPGDVVSREELRRRLWPNGIFVDFEHSLNAAVKRLRSALGDDADRPRFVETLPRRGYRFIAELDDEVERTGSVEPRHGLEVRLVVLPFTNLSDDPAQEYFSDGLTEELIAQLGATCRGRMVSLRDARRTHSRARQCALERSARPFEPATCSKAACAASVIPFGSPLA